MYTVGLLLCQGSGHPPSHPPLGGGWLKYRGGTKKPILARFYALVMGYNVAMETRHGVSARAEA